MAVETMLRKELSLGASLVLDILTSFAKKRGTAWVSSDWLCSRIGRSLRSLQRYISELKARGRLQEERDGHNKPARYRLQEPDLFTGLDDAPSPGPTNLSDKSDKDDVPDSLPQYKDEYVLVPPLSTGKSGENPPTSAKEKTLKFELSPEQLGQEYAFLSRCPAATDKDPYKAAETFRELIRIGIAPDRILHAIKDPVRNRTQWLSQFCSDLTRKRAGPVNGHMDFSGLREFAAKGQVQ